MASPVAPSSSQTAPSSSPMAPSSAQKLTTNDALTYLKAVKDLFNDNKEKYNEFIEVMRDFKSQRIDLCNVISRVEELFKEHRELILGFSNFLPDGFEIKVPVERKPPVVFHEAIDFVNRIKSRFQNDEDTYKSFLCIMNLYRMERKSGSEVLQEVGSLFKNNEDLFLEFAQFLPKTSTSTAPNASSPGKPDSRCDKLRHPSMEKIHDKDNDKEHERSCIKKRGLERVEDREHKRINRGPSNVFEDAAYHHKVSLFSIQEECNLDKPISELERETGCIKKRGLERVEDDRENKRINRGPSNVSEDAANHKVPLFSNKGEHNIDKPISELDLSNCERCTPSYRLLPENCRTPASSDRTELDASVLNDSWVSVTSGSEDHSFNHSRKNQYEEVLFRCEDDRYELDMLLESATSTAKRVEELLEKMQDEVTKPQTPFRIEDHLTALNLRCIERLYGDHGLDVMDVLNENAGLALPIILARLKQKQEEWSRCRADFNKVWSEIYNENHNK